MTIIGRCFALTSLAGLVDEELHAIEFLQQVVRKLDIGLVDFVNQEDRLLVGLERLPDLASVNVVGNVVYLVVAKLRIPQSRDRVVLVQPLLRLGGRLDVPFEQRLAERFARLR